MGARVWGFAAALAMGLCWGSQASAFCRTTTCDPMDPKQNCIKDGTNCITSGRPLFWESLCVSFGVQQDGSPLRNIPFDVAIEVVSDGFLAWINADCGGGARPSLLMATQGKIICDQQDYNSDGPNANIWVFRDEEWPHPNLGDHTLALTTVTFNIDTGEIFDADVEINSKDNDLTISETAVRADLPSIVTHEAGHFLGLSHSAVETATMFKTYTPGTITLRTLDPDDVDGICAAFPPERSTPTESCEPRHGFSSECVASAPETEGCRCMAPGRSRQSGAATAGALALLAFAARRRRRRRTAPFGSAPRQR
jgi:hypothetical protein